jgi:UDP-N-acetylmuramoyl-tripeptide--D-alanyl-D-alanine ligase
MRAMSINAIAEAIGSPWRGEGMVTEVVTDSRLAGPGSLFVPIVGENMDGHRFIADAFKRGAAFALSSREEFAWDSRVLPVADTKQAHIDIAACYLKGFDIKVVGITGSVGKTTTKEFVAAVLSSRYRVLKNEGNKNNEIGLPETVFGLTESHDVAVLEMGMSGLGEIRQLALATAPHAGIITNIHGVHLEHLGSIENILKAKLELVEGLRSGAPLFLCGDNAHLKDVLLPGVNCVFYGAENPDCAIKAIDIYDNGWETHFTIRSPYGCFDTRIPTTGAHFVPNALAAFGVGCALGIPPAEAAAALWNYAPSGMRQRPVEFMGGLVIEDCYNASPVSVQGAIDTLQSMPCTGRRMMVLSDMLELGAESKQLHMDIGRAVAEANLDALLVWGRDARYYLEGAAQAGYTRGEGFATKQALAEAIRKNMGPGDIVWVKGSRGMALEEMLELLYGGNNHA